MTRIRRQVLVALLPVALAMIGVAPLGPSLFSSDARVTLQIEAPLNELFDNARQKDDYAVTGAVTYGGETGTPATIENVKITVRGHTSLRETECTFPKLKLRFEPPPRDGLFAGLRDVKIGTHCGESAGETLSPKYGRLPNENSPLREAFVYRLLGVLQVPSLKARPAQITYIYTDPKTGASPDQRQPLVRHAMLLEDDDAARARLGGGQEILPAAFGNAQQQFAAEDTARLAFAQALIGNFDWCLKFTADDTYRCDARRILWNITALRSNGRTIPVMYDFDVTGMVAGRHSWFDKVYNEAFVSSKSHAEVEVLGQVQRTRSLFSREVLDATRARFMERKAEAYSALQGAPLDEGGRARIREYLDAFYKAIGSDDAFYRPVVTASGTNAYTTAGRTTVVCPDRGAVPPGTAVSDPVETSGTMIKVVLLDTQWNWATPNKCPEIHKGAVWIEKAAISKDFPKSTVATTRQ